MIINNVSAFLETLLCQIDKVVILDSLFADEEEVTAENAMKHQLVAFDDLEIINDYDNAGEMLLRMKPDQHPKKEGRAAYVGLLIRGEPVYVTELSYPALVNKFHTYSLGDIPVRFLDKPQWTQPSVVKIGLFDRLRKRFSW